MAGGVCSSSSPALSSAVMPETSPARQRRAMPARDPGRDRAPPCGPAPPAHRAEPWRWRWRYGPHPALPAASGPAVGERFRCLPIAQRGGGQQRGRSQFAPALRHARGGGGQALNFLPPRADGARGRLAVLPLCAWLSSRASQAVSDQLGIIARQEHVSPFYGSDSATGAGEAAKAAGLPSLATIQTR